jgi:hypothetical protein
MAEGSTGFFLPLAEAMSPAAAFSMNHAARNNATGMGSIFRASSIRPSAFNRFG